MTDPFAGYTISTGVVRARDLAYLLGTNPDRIRNDDPHTRIWVYDAGRWIVRDLDWIAHSGTVCHVPDERFIAIADLGYVLALGGGKFAIEPSVGSGPASEPLRGHLVAVREVARGRAYAVGVFRQAYVREAPGRWRCFDHTARNFEGVDPSDTCFKSIDGFSETEIYAVGWGGEIWLYDGSRWLPIESPTNLALYQVRCAGDGNVYAAGQVGTLLRGRRERWELIDHDATEEDFWGMEWFNDLLFLSTTRLLYTLQGRQLKRIDMGATPFPNSCYHLSAADGILWSIGARDVMQYDGQTWTRIV